MLALVIIGQMRSYQNIEIINSYQKYLFQGEPIDLYIFTWKKIGYSHRHGDPNIHANCDDTIDKSEIMTHFDKYNFINIKHIFIEDFDEFIKSLNNDLLQTYNTPFKDHSNISTCVPIEYKYQQAIRYLSNVEDIEKYSNLIITRPDMCFVDYLPTLNTELDNIYYNCICTRCFDHCWYGKPETQIKLLYNIFDNLIENKNKITCMSQNNRDNNELLHYQCNQKNIKIQVKQKHLVKIVYI
jgi:hypothetical protein